MSQSDNFKETDHKLYPFGTEESSYNNRPVFDSDDEVELGSSHQSSNYYSTAEEKFIREHDLKVKALEALHNHDSHGKGSFSGNKRKQSFLDLPPQHLPEQFRNTTYVSASMPLNLYSQEGTGQDDMDKDEIIELYEKLKMCLDLRHRYIDISVQGDERQNPKNQPDWVIYPPPPKPTYKSKNKFNQVVRNDHEEEEFDFNKCDIPKANGKFYFDIDLNDVFQAYDAETKEPISKVPTLSEYYSDLNKITKISSGGPAKSFAFKRLQFLEAKWNMYYLLHEFEENKQSKRNPHRDFYNVRKVDTHIHHSACMNQKHLLRFIKYKLKTEPNEKVIFRDGKILTLAEVFESLNLTAYDLSIDTLDMHAHTDTFHRFDKFNLKYNPIGESRLREIFLKTDNFINGRYLAELTKQVSDDLESSKYQMAELRISVYGRSIHEWDKLASWVIDNKVFSHNVRWLVQIPRLYDMYKNNGNVETFHDILNNVFRPLFEVSIDPQSHPKLHVFLQRVIGFDSVDDESKPEIAFQPKHMPRASEWNHHHNPPYSYYVYYLYANIASLNQLRRRNGFNTFLLRPHCGEAGDPEHLIAAFLTSHSISHGILLRKIPFIQYLFYLDQIGMAMSPLSNNALFLTYDKNPFYGFFKKGLNVSLSTDDPLQFSYTKEPLIEEYSVAAQIYKFSSVDMCELAANSVRQSGWEVAIKKHWLGKNYLSGGVENNDIEKTNVPNIRVAFREETLRDELGLMNYYLSSRK